MMYGLQVLYMAHGIGIKKANKNLKIFIKQFEMPLYFSLMLADRGPQDQFCIILSCIFNVNHV